MIRRAFPGLKARFQRAPAAVSCTSCVEYKNWFIVMTNTDIDNIVASTLVRI